MCALLQYDGDARRHLPFLVVVESRAYIDRDRAGGDVLCPDCGQKYYDHTPCPGAEWLTVLCDGSVVKL